LLCEVTGLSAQVVLGIPNTWNKSGKKSISKGQHKKLDCALKMEWLRVK
jgi:hypothetical protein